MNPEEYYKLAEIEQTHWFYSGKRAIVKDWIEHYHPLKADDIFVDVGCGTGLLVEEMRPRCVAVGMEPAVDALAINRHAGRHVIAADCGQPLPLKSNSVAVATALDVLEHLRDDRAALSEIIRVLRPGGLAIITVPAFPFLMSDWDESLGHYRRYKLEDFPRLLQGFPVTILEHKYINSVFFVPIMFYRLGRKILRLRGQNRMEDKIPPAVINKLMYRMFVSSACERHNRPPFGLSILLILRKQS